MLKVFLVEDEIVIREGIKNNIKWEEEGFDFVGEASDGEIAFPKILKLKPDILITDIKMPFTDGLELSRIVKRELPKVKIIILSGYNDFDYAKEAINIGVTEYLLKPISSEKLLHAVKEIAKKIEEEKEQHEYLNQFKLDMKENKSIAKQKFFNELIFKELSLSEILDQANDLEMDLMAQSYNIILFKVMVSGETATCYSKDINDITEKVQEIMEQQDNIFMFDRGAEGWAFLLKGSSDEDYQFIIEHTINKVVEIIKEYPSLEFFGGIGKSVIRISEIPESYDKANQAFSHRYMGKSNQIISYRQFEDNMLLDDYGMDFSGINISKFDRKLLENFLKIGSVEEVKQFVMDYFRSLGKDNINSLIFRQYILMDMYFVVAAFVESMGYSQEDIVNNCGNLKKVTQVISTVEKSRDFIEKAITKALQARDNVSMKKYEKMLQQAKNFINDFYHSEDISLNSVAANVNISPSYFSTIFSQELEQTFIQYLTDVRMKKAKELLMCSNMKTSEVGFEIGYKDPHYFSYLFKKTQNCTPKEYRLRGKECNEMTGK